MDLPKSKNLRRTCHGYFPLYISRPGGHWRSLRLYVLFAPFPLQASYSVFPALLADPQLIWNYGTVVALSFFQALHSGIQFATSTSVKTT